VVFLWRLTLSRKFPFPSRLPGSYQASSHSLGEMPGYALVCILPLSLSSTCVSLLDPTVPPVLSLPGAVRGSWLPRTALDFYFRHHVRLRQVAFLFTDPEAMI
jgi:hypothetical protein